MNLVTGAWALARGAISFEILPLSGIAPPAPAADIPAVSRPGELWVLGEHRLYCGSALDQACYQGLLKGDRADLVFTDPPYNVRIDGHGGWSRRNQTP